MNRRRRYWVALGLLVSLAILAWLVLGHQGEFRTALRGADWRFAAAAMAWTAASYAMMGMALWEILNLLGYRRSFLEVLGITFVSGTANYLVSSAGISGFALKAHLLSKRRVPYGATVTASVLSTALLYCVLGLFIAEGLGYLMLKSRGTGVPVLEGALGLVVLTITSVPILMFFFNRDVRGRLTRLIFHWSNLAVYSVSKREIPREDFVEFERQLEEGLALVRAQRGKLTRAIGYTCLDWVFAWLVMDSCFRAAGWNLGLGPLSAAFAVGQAAALIPFLPGGLGAAEGAMGAVLQGLGVGWGEILLALLLYRLCYYLLPGVGSVFILWGLKVSEPGWVQETVLDTLPEELRRGAAALERQSRR